MLKDKLIFILAKVLAAILLIALTALIILFASDRNLPFLSSEEQEYSIFTESSEPVSEDVSNVNGESSYVSDESAETSEPNADDFKKVISSFTVTTPAVPSYEIFDAKKHVLTLLDTSSYIGMNDGSVTLKMGYIIAEKDGEKHIYSPNGRDITSLVGDKTLTTSRDTVGRPLFTDANGKYYFLDANGAIAPSSYNAKEDGRGFTCETPRYLGVQHSEIKRFCKNGLFGFRTTSGIDVLAPLFREAFAFGSEGVGCVLQRYGSTEYFIFYSYANYKTVSINMDYFPPENRGEDALGYFYFDDGLVRVRRKNAAGGFDDLLVDSAVKPVTLPSDYELVSYTDSRILLKKADRYGFMTSRFEWISLPEYTSASPFYEGLAVVGGENGKKGVIDRDGNVVIPFVFDYISNCSDGLILAHESENGWFVFSKNAR